MTVLEKVYYIDVDLMKKMCHPIAVALFDSTVDPMTKFEEHEIEKLESALANPMRTYGGKDLYPALEEKAAILYYGLNKDHPFRNGNKRTATAALLVFLFMNNFWIVGSRQQVEDYLVDLAQRVASSKGSEGKDVFLTEIAEWVGTHIQKLPQSQK